MADKKDDTAGSEYNADALSVLKGLEAVRVRPGMYIGSTDSRGLMHLIWEIVDNSVDEAAAGHCSRIEVILHKDGSFEVHDNGRGIPVDVEKSTGKSGLELIFTELHAGGKFGGGGYAASGGLHGVGASVVNALSTKLVSEVDRNGKTYRVEFKDGTTGRWDGDTFTAKDGIRETGKSTGTGTRVQWWPNTEIFDRAAKVDKDLIVSRMRQICFLVPGLTVVLRDEAHGDVQEFTSEDGISDFCEFLTHGEKVTDVIKLTGSGTYTENIPQMVDGALVTTEVERTMDVEVALRWTAGWEPLTKSFVNTITTPKGGTHTAGFERALTRVVNEALRENKVLKDKDDNVIKDDVQEGLVAVVRVVIVEPQFEGQTKEILGTPAAQSIVYQVVSEGLREWFGRNAKKPGGRNLMQKVSNAAKARIAARTQRETVRRKNAIESSSLPAKLADCRTHDLERSEIAIIEGDSAAGTVKAARDSEFQALLPIRGKILNVAKATPKQVLENNEVVALISALGAGSGKDFDTSSLRYGRLILMSVPGREPVLVRTPRGHLSLRKIGDVVDESLADGIDVPALDTVSLSTEDSSISVAPIKKVIRHRYAGKMVTVTTAYGRKVSVTAGHSVFTWEDGCFTLREGDELEPGMLVVAPRRLPRGRAVVELDMLDIARRLGRENIRVVGDTVLLSKRSELPEAAGERRVELDLAGWVQLAAHRKGRGISSKAVAASCGVHPSSLCGFEHGRGRPTESVFRRYLAEIGAEWPAGASLAASQLERWGSTSSKNANYRRTSTSAWLHELDHDQVAQLGRDVKLHVRAHRDSAFSRFRPVTEELCEFLGWFTAEGTTDRRGRVSLALGQDDLPYIPRIISLVESLFGETPRTYQPKDSNGIQLYFHSTDAALILCGVGLDRIAVEKRVPDLLLNVDESCQLAYLAGLYLGDGTKGRTDGRLIGKSIRFSTSSEDLANGISYVLGQLGLMASVSTVSGESNVLSDRDSYSVTVGGVEQVGRLRRVWKDAVNAGAVRAYLDTAFTPSQRHCTDISDTLVALPIRSIEVEEVDEDVYDFSVADDESFVTGFGGGICAHNTDADVDGSHIRVLLLTLVYHYMRPLLEEGRVYSAMPPLYLIKVSGAKEQHYAYTDDEKEQILARIEAEGKKVREIQRFKGLGEMDAEQLAVTTMDPNTRSLRRISMDDAVEASRVFDVLMGNAVEPRREFIVSRAEDFDNDKLDV